MNDGMPVPQRLAVKEDWARLTARAHRSCRAYMIQYMGRRERARLFVTGVQPSRSCQPQVEAAPSTVHLVGYARVCA